MKIILEAITKNCLVIEKTIMKLKDKFYFKIVTLEKMLTDYRMKNAMCSKVSTLEDANIGLELKL
jgi:transposase